MGCSACAKKRRQLMAAASQGKFRDVVRIAREGANMMLAGAEKNATQSQHKEKTHVKR